MRAKSEARETLDKGHVRQVSLRVVIDYLRDLRDVLDLGTVGQKRIFLGRFLSRSK